MKVISGKFKGKKLYTPRHIKIRLTSSIVKRAIFDFLQNSINEKSILDLYAGTGAMGIEALSRGARKSIFVEKDTICVEIIKKNIAQLKDVEIEILPVDVFMALRLLKGEIFDIIFLDPPYREKLVKSTLLELAECGIVDKNSLVIAEHYKKEIIKDKIGNFVLMKQKKYGDTVVSIFKYVKVC